MKAVPLYGLMVLASISSMQAKAGAEPVTPPFSESASIAIDKLRQFCAACHAVGSIKFIDSDDNAKVWQALFTERSPITKDVWRDRIIQVLNWPAGKTPPESGPIMDPARKLDWMPKGFKRIQLADDFQDNTPTRAFIIEQLSQ